MLEKLRSLGQFGIISDQDSYDLPPQAFSSGVNIRFAEGRVQRAPCFKSILALSTAPRFVVNLISNLAADSLYVGYLNGRVKSLSATAETDVSISGYTPVTSEAQWSSTVLSRVLYVNREDRVPWALTPGASIFANLANWDATYRTHLLRSFNSSLVALGITKGANLYPTMVKTSDFALDGAVPTDWNPADATNNVYENVIDEMSGSITEAQPLHTSLMIYSQTETWEMRPTGDTSLYSITNVFRDAGCLNTNCVVEVNNKHYVFGSTDIWVHDGVSKQSISDKRSRRFVFANLNTKQASRCFVHHNPLLKEILFCFVSADSLVTFNEPTSGCNRAAVYNYVDDNWTYYDLPLVFGATLSNIANSANTWDQLTTTWDQFAGRWSDMDDGFKHGSVMVGETDATYGLVHKLYGHDPFQSGAVFNFPVDANATPGAQLYRNAIDLDELNVELRGYIQINAVYPEARLDKTGALLQFSFGAADGFNDTPIFDPYQTYDGDTLYKIDCRAAGRYLSMQMLYSDFKTMSLSGYDLDLIVTGSR